MRNTEGRLWTIRAHGRLAHFGGIPLGPERATMMVPSHSAIVGILRSFFGKYEARWCIESLAVLTWPKIVPIMQNQLRDFQSKNYAPINIEEKRTQRIWTYLENPDYVIRARIGLGPTAGADDNLIKFDEMIARRLSQGYRRYEPYFGIRECSAYLSLVENEAALSPPIALTQDFGLSFYDIDIDDPQQPAYLAPLKIECGIVKYPTFDEVKKFGIKYQLPRRA